MTKEHALIAGMFISGLLRCNMAQQIQQQYLLARAEGSPEPERKLLAKVALPNSSKKSITCKTAVTQGLIITVY